MVADTCTVTVHLTWIILEPSRKKTGVTNRLEILIDLGYADQRERLNNVTHAGFI